MFVATRHAWRLIRRAGQYLGELVDYLMPLVDEKNDDRSGDVDGHSKSHDLPKAREETSSHLAYFPLSVSLRPPTAF